MRVRRFRIEVFRKQHIDNGIAETTIIGPIIPTELCFLAKSCALRHSAAEVIARITSDFDPVGRQVAERCRGELPNHFGDIPFALHRCSAPVPDLELRYLPVVRMKASTENKRSCVFEECMNAEVFPRFIPGLGSRKHSLCCLQRLEG